MGLVDISPKLSMELQAMARNIADGNVVEVEKYMDMLDPVTRGWIEQVIRELRRDGQSQLLNRLRRRDFEREPVTIDEFFTPKYLGKYSKGIYPVWMNDMRYVETNNVYEWVITGSTGSGKTRTARNMMVYKLHVISCLRDPAEFYGHQPGDLTIFGVYSITLNKADKLYEGLDVVVRDSPYFQECYSPKSKTKLVFRNNVEIIAGSNELHALGDDLLVFCIDEMNFMKGSDELSKAHKLYAATLTRMRNRFMQDGQTPGLAILISSRKSESDWLERHVAEVVKENRTAIFRGQSPHSYVSDYPVWEMNRSKYSPQTFCVLVGDRFTPSRIVEHPEALLQNSMDKESVKARMIYPPIDFLTDFERDTETAVRDIAGRATVAVSPLIKDRKSILDAFDSKRSNPFKKNPITISTKTAGVHIMDFVDKSVLFRVIRSAYTPRINPEAKRWLHVDLGLVGDRAGVVMGHVAGYGGKINYRLSDKGVVLMIPNIMLDFMLAIDPPTDGGEIDLQEIVNFITTLKAMGYKFEGVSYDGFQSAHSCQLLRHAGFDNATVFSVDRSDVPYKFVRATLTDRRLNFPPGPVNAVKEDIVVKELSELEHDQKAGKVDHPDREGTSKDVTDGIASVVYNLTMMDPPNVDPSHIEEYMDVISKLMTGTASGAGVTIV